MADHLHFTTDPAGFVDKANGGFLHRDIETDKVLHIALPFLMLVAVGQTTFYHQLEALHLLASPLKMGLKPNTPSDSDNTTTRPFVTRRRVLEGTAIAIVGAKGNEFVSNALETNQSVDPAVAVWQKWQAAHDLTEWLCRKQQRLERKLVETVGFPSANVRLRDGESVTTHSLEALHELTGDAAVRAKAEAELAAHQARWDAADREIGYSTTLLAECEAGDRVEQLLEMLSETPAASLAGVAALGKAKSPKTVLSFPGHRSARSSRILVGLVNRHRRVEWSQTGRVDRSIIDSGCFHFATKQLTQREESGQFEIVLAEARLLRNARMPASVRSSSFAVRRLKSTMSATRIGAS